MNYTGMSKSNYVEVADTCGIEDTEGTAGSSRTSGKQQLQDFVDHARSEGWANFQTYWHDGRFAIGSSHGPMSIYEDIVSYDDFFAVLGDCIAEPMVIRSVGYEGMRYTPDAWQWVVYPDGTWTYTGFDDAHTVKEKYESEELSGQVVNERTDS